MFAFQDSFLGEGVFLSGDRVYTGCAMTDIAQAGQHLADLRRSFRCEDNLPPELRPRDFAESYAVQDALVSALLAEHGGHRIGFKIAFTNEAVQKQFGVDGPMFGQILSYSAHSSPARLSASRFHVRCIEIEFGFVMGRDVPADREAWTPETIAEFVDSMVPALEIVDHRFTDWLHAPALTVAADNATNAAWAYGERTQAWREVDLASHEVHLSVGGEVVRRGRGEAALGSPLNVLAWLAGELPRHGHSLSAGDHVTTGVCTEIYLAEAGDEIVGDFGALGRVELSFDA